MSAKTFVLLFGAVGTLSYLMLNLVALHPYISGQSATVRLAQISPGSYNYDLNVDGENYSGSSGDSTNDNQAPPTAPTNLKLRLLNGNVVVEWTDTSANESYFRINRKNLANNTEYNRQVAPNSRSTTDIAVQAGVRYRYQAVACNQAGCSSPTSPKEILVPTGQSTQSTQTEQTERIQSSGNSISFSESSSASVSTNSETNPNGGIVVDSSPGINSGTQNSDTDQTQTETPPADDGESGNSTDTSDTTADADTDSTASGTDVNQSTTEEPTVETGSETTETTEEPTEVPSVVETAVEATGDFFFTVAGNRVTQGSVVRDDVTILAESSVLDVARLVLYRENNRESVVTMSRQNQLGTSWRYVWNVSDFNPGTYLFALHGQTESETDIFLKQKRIILEWTVPTEQAIEPSIDKPKSSETNNNEPDADQMADKEPAPRTEEETTTRESTRQTEVTFRAVEEPAPKPRVKEPPQTAKTSNQSPKKRGSNAVKDEPKETIREVLPRNATTSVIALREEQLPQLKASNPVLATCTETECLEVCSVATNRGKCADFTTTKVNTLNTQPDLFIRSVADALETEKLDNAIKRRLVNFESVEQARSFCSDDTNAFECQAQLFEAGVVDLTDLAVLNSKVIENKRSRMLAFAERVGAREVLDTDADGITDYDEVAFYGTDPNNADTDADGEDDGVELKANRNPVIPASQNESDERILEDPRISGEVATGLLLTENVYVVPESAMTQATTTVFEGRAQPNSLVTVFVFSTPLMVAVKADREGAWRLEFGEELPDGSHTVYAAVTDTSGSILAKSNALPFVKVAQAVTLGSDDIEPLAQGGTSPLASYPFQTTLLLVLLLSVALFGGIALLGYRNMKLSTSERPSQD